MGGAIPAELIARLNPPLKQSISTIHSIDLLDK
jgi:hypothetical protein